MGRGAAWGCALAAALLVPAPIAGRADDGTAPALIYSVRVNGAVVSQGTIVLVDPDGTMLVRLDDLRSWRVIPPRGRTAIRDDIEYLPITAIPTWHIVVDQAKLILDMTVPVADLVTTNITLQRAAAAPPQAHAGAFLDYDLHEHVQARTASTLGALWQLGVSGAGSVALGSFVSTAAAGRLSTIRLDTSWQHDFVDRRASLRIGDAITGVGAFGGGVHFSGVQFATNFSTDPYFVTFPTPSISGSASLPSVVDIYVNNALTASQNVNAGPIQLTQLPVVNGAGQVQLVVTDVLGRRQVVTEPYYASPILLKRGLSDYSYDAGFERLSYGVASNDYGSHFFAGTERLGISDSFTGEAHGEFTEGMSMYSLGTDLALGNAGVLNAAGAVSRSPVGDGSAMLLGYEYSGGRFGFGGRVQRNSDGFRQISFVNQVLQVRLQEQALLSFPIGRRASVASSYTARIGTDASSTRFGTISFSQPIGRSSFFMQALKQLGARVPLLASIFLVMPLDTRHSVTESVQVQGGEREERLAIQQSLPASTIGTAYRLQAQQGSLRQYEGSVTVQGQPGTLTVSATDLGAGLSYDVDGSGAVALIDRHAFLTRQIDASYGLAELPGYSDVRVYVNNQEAGRTNRYGIVGLPTLLPYQANTVAVEPRDLPVAANVQNAKVIAVPYFRSPSIVRFAAQPPGGALLTVVDVDGKPLPAGAILRLESGAGEWPIADNGMAYVTGAPGTELHFVVTIGVATCRLVVKLPQDLSQIPDLGTTICR